MPQVDIPRKDSIITVSWWAIYFFPQSITNGRRGKMIIIVGNSTIHRNKNNEKDGIIVNENIINISVIKVKTTTHSLSDIKQYHQYKYFINIIISKNLLYLNRSFKLWRFLKTKFIVEWVSRGEINITAIESYHVHWWQQEKLNASL